MKEREGRKHLKPNLTIITNLDYPSISDKLIECLERDYPNVLPNKYISEFELGIKIGEQNVIKKLKFEKGYNEHEASNEDEEE